MKRSRSEKTQRSLNVTELSSTLNGSDANAILKILKRFSRQVQRERALAVGNEIMHPDGDDGSDTDDNGEEEQQKETKKPKKLKESWKEDTASYNVPFVGTSIASSVKTSSVKVGEWPTGILKDYLEQSPLAVEFTSDILIPPDGHVHKSLMNKNQSKLSHDLHQDYLQALAQLVTAAIPIHHFNEGKNETTPHPAASSSHVFIGEVAKHRLAGLVQVLSTETGNGKGRPTVTGGVGPLAPLVMRVLSNLILTSVGTARLVLESMEQQLPEGVLRLVLRPQKANTESSRVLPRHQARVEALHLVSKLMKVGDHVIWSRLTSPGARDRKIRPGLLVLALREGLTESSDPPLDSYVASVEEILGLLCSVLQSGRRNLIEVISLEMVTSVTRMAVAAPPLESSSSVSLDSVLRGEIPQSHKHRWDLVNSLARRLVFCLLGDGQRSPLLKHLSLPSSKRAETCGRILERIVGMIMESKSSLSTGNLLLECLSTKSHLARLILDSMTFPEPSRAFSFVARIHWTCKVYRCAPLMSSGGIYLPFFPKKLKKATISKALNSRNHLVAVETIKFLTLALRRTLAIYEEKNQSQSSPGRDTLSWMVDSGSLVSLLKHPKANDSSLVLADALCSLLRQVLTMSADTVIDPVKLIPRDLKSFCRCPVYYQLKVVRLVRAAVDQSSVPLSASNILQFSLWITIVTRRRTLYREARELSIALIRIADENRCSNFEAECWIDGLTKGCLSLFCDLVSNVPKSSLREKVMISVAWSEAGIPGSPTGESASSMLGLALRRGSKSNLEMMLLTHQVAVKCLLYLKNPLIFAALLIVHGSQGSTWDFVDQTTLFARSFLELTRVPATRNHRAVWENALSKLFLSGSFFTAACTNHSVALPSVSVDRSQLGRDALYIYRQAKRRFVAVSSTTKVLPEHFLSPLVPFALLAECSSEGLGSNSPSVVFQQQVLRNVTEKGSPISSPAFLRRSPGSSPIKLLVNLVVSKSFMIPLELLSLTNTLMLQNSINQTELTLKVALECYQQVSSSLTPEVSSFGDEAVALFQSWSKLSDDYDSEDKRTCNLLLCMEQCLHRLLQCHLLPLQVAILRTSQGEVILRSVNSRLAQKSAGLKPCEFLTALVLNNIESSASYILDGVVRKNPSLTKAFEEGVLDSILLLIYKRKISADCPGDWKRLSSRILLVTNRRILGSPQRSLTISDDFRDLFATLDSSDFSQASFDAVSVLAHSVTQSLGDPSSTGCANLCWVASKLIPHLDRDRRSNLVCKTLHHMLHLVSRLMKQWFKSGVAPGKEMDKIPELVCLILENTTQKHLNDPSLRMSITKFTKAVLRVCMRQGLSSSVLILVKTSLSMIAATIRAFCVTDSLNTEGIGSTIPNEVFVMVTQHSRFNEILEDSDEFVATEILELLQMCTKHSTIISFDRGLCQALVRQIRGSFQRKDKILRDLVRLYQEGCEEKLHLDQMNPGSTGSRWDWLSTWITLDRVRSTLSSFPVKEGTQADSPNLFAYSPAYTLPLILASIEEALSISLQPNENGIEFSEKLLRRAHVLCLNGGLALALGSLCCHDPDTRRLAAVILLTIRFVASSVDARKMTSWRERPQITMLLESVHRGLAVHASEASQQDAMNVPRLPGTSAIFLANAALALMKPGHGLFVPSNRYFLKIEDSGGAFPDLYRLPMFISLFCTTTEDASEAERERILALELLCDSFVDEDCFRPLLACHAPELLLTSFHRASDREICLLIGVLSKILANGGTKASSHMICRIGLFAWIQGLLAESVASDIFSTTNSIETFSSLVLLTTKKAKEVLPEQEFLSSSKLLPRPLLEFALEKVQSQRSNEDWWISVNEAICDTLSIIGGCLEGGEDEHNHGLSPSRVQQLFLLLPELERKKVFCRTVCCLPVSPLSNNVEGDLDFCATFIAFCTKLEAPSLDLTVSVLQRVSCLIERCSQHAPKLPLPLINNLLVWRQWCSSNRKTYNLWRKSINALLQYRSDNTKSLSMTQQMLAALPS